MHHFFLKQKKRVFCDFACTVAAQRILSPMFEQHKHIYAGVFKLSDITWLQSDYELFNLEPLQSDELDYMYFEVSFGLTQ